MIDSLPYLFISLAVILASGWLGDRTLALTGMPAGSNATERRFLAHLLGTVHVSFYTGILFSGGQTLQWMLLVAFLILLYEIRKQNHPLIRDPEAGTGSFFKLSNKEWLTYASVIAAIFVWQLTQHVGADGKLTIPHEDLIFYADVSQNLMMNGYENQYLFGAEHSEWLQGISPYHYFELWCNGIVSYITENHLLTFLFVTQVWMLFLVWMGFRALLSRMVDWSDVKCTLASLGGLFLITFNPGIFIDTGFWKYADAMSGSPTMTVFQKSATLYPFLIAAFIVWRAGKSTIALVILLFLPVVSVTAAPVAILSFGVFAKRMHPGMLRFGNEHVRMFTYTVIYLAAYFIIALSYGAPVSRNMGLGAEELSSLTEKPYIADAWYLLTRVPLILIVSITPWIVLHFIAGKSNEKSPAMRRLFIVTATLAILGLVSWIFFRYQGADSMQFFTLTSSVALNILLFIIWSNALNGNMISKVAAIVFVIGGFTYITMENSKSNGIIRYDEEYVKTVLEWNETMSNPDKAFILSPETYVEDSDFCSYFNRPAQFLALHADRDVLVNIGMDHSPEMENSLYRRTQWRTSFMWQYIIEKDSRLTIGKEFLQFQLLREHEFGMIFLGKGVELPETLIPFLKKRITDPVSGESCVLLENFEKE